MSEKRSEAPDASPGGQPDSTSGVIELVAASVAGATAAAFGLIGEPAAAIAAGGAVPAVTEGLTRAVGAIVTRRRIRAAQLLEHAATTADLPPAELVKRLGSTSAGLGLLTKSILAAGDTAVDEHVRAIGTALARGALDESTIDQETMFVATMADIGAVHVRVLLPFAGNASQTPIEGVSRGRAHYGQKRRRTSLPHEHPDLKAVLAPIIATLLRHGLIREVDETSPFPSNGVTDEQTFKLTDYGVAVLGRLLDAGALEGGRDPHNSEG